MLAFRYQYNPKDETISEAIIVSKDLFFKRFGYHPERVLVRRSEFDRTIKSDCEIIVDINGIQSHHFDLSPVVLKRTPKLLSMERTPA